MVQAEQHKGLGINTMMATSSLTVNQDTQNFSSEWVDDDDQQKKDFHDESELTMNRTPTNQESNVPQLLNVMDGSTDALRWFAEEVRVLYGFPPNMKQAECDLLAQHYDWFDIEEFLHQIDISPAKLIAVFLKMQLRITKVVLYPAQAAPIGIGGCSAVMMVDATTATPFDRHRFKDMPKFSGDPFDWSEFMAQLEESVIKTDLERVYRLCRKGTSKLPEKSGHHDDFHRSQAKRRLKILKNATNKMPRPSTEKRSTRI